MIAFTSPGQGSQRPGFGHHWLGHPSWELVDEASEVAGRDVAALLLDADAEALRQTRAGEVWPANFNGPGNTVIAGTEEAVGQAEEVAHHDVVGECPHLAERLLVSPVSGVFRRSSGVDDGAVVSRGDEVGRVSGHPVRSAFAGRLMSFLAMEGERVTPSQPVAWLLDAAAS